ncbi:Conserved PhiRv2-like prophage protein of uncharacterised function (modular protein) [Mycolicibacterium flavescens]|nr:Conserved PhiRv2-like prophage protein of uncharacterised function (modular protein) [Mycolicibacterium flavescens]
MTEDRSDELAEWYAEDNPDGAAEVLDAVEVFIRRFCLLPGEHCYVAATLWSAHTHFIDRLETTPRFACLSPEPGSGKTRVLEVLDVLCANPLMALDISMSAFFRIVEDRQPTILLDEVDAIFIGKKQSEGSEDMRRVINNGYRVGAVVQRVGGKNRDEVQDFHVFTPVAMAGLGNLPDTLMSRSVIIRMKPRRGGESLEPFRDRLHRPEGEKLQAQMAAWAASVTDDLQYPTLPDGVQDRDADVWEPLIMVADLAGGEWPARAREACSAFISEKPESAVSLGVRLLRDLKRIWPADAATMPTADVLKKLAELDEAPWGDLYGEGLKPRKLAQLLSDYDIKSQDVWTPLGSRKGYRREDFWDPWLRYVPPEKGDVRDVGDEGDAGLADLADLADPEGTRDTTLFNALNNHGSVDWGASSTPPDAAQVAQCCDCGRPIPKHMHASRDRGICSRCTAVGNAKARLSGGAL